MPTPRFTPPPAYEPVATGSANIMAPLENIMTVLSQSDARRQAERKLDYMGEDTATRAFRAQTQREELLLKQEVRRADREYKQAELSLKEQDLMITRAYKAGSTAHDAGMLTLYNARLSAQSKREDALTELGQTKNELVARGIDLDEDEQKKRFAYLEAVLKDKGDARVWKEKLAAEKDDAKKAQLQMQFDARMAERKVADDAEMARLMAKEDSLDAREAAKLNFLRDKQSGKLDMFDEVERRKEAESLRNYELANQKLLQSETQFETLDKQFNQALKQKEKASARTDTTRNRAIDVNVMMFETKLAADAAGLEKTLAEKELERLRREGADAGAIRQKEAELNAKKEQFNRAQAQKERIDNMASERAQLKLVADNAKSAAQTAFIKTKDQLQQLAYQQQLAEEQRQQSAREIAGVKLSGMLASISKTQDDPIENTLATYEVLRQFGYVGYGDTSTGDKAVVEANRGLLTPDMSQALQGVMEAQSRQMIEYGEGDDKKTVSRMEAISKLKTDGELREHFNKHASIDQKTYLVDMVSGSDPAKPRAVLDIDGNIVTDARAIPGVLGLREFEYNQAVKGAAPEVTRTQVRQAQMMANDAQGMQLRLQQEYGIMANLSTGDAPTLMSSGQVLVSKAFRQVTRENGKLTDDGIKAQTHNAALFSAATTAITGGLSPDQLDMAWAGLDTGRNGTSQYLDALKTRQQGLATAYEYANAVPGLGAVLPTLSNEKLDMMNNITQQIGGVRPGQEVDPVDGMAMGDILGALAGKSASKNSTLANVIKMPGVTHETVLQVARSEARAAYIERTYNGGPEGEFTPELFKQIQQGGEPAYTYLLNNQDAFVTFGQDAEGNLTRSVDTKQMTGVLTSFVAKQSATQLADSFHEVTTLNGNGSGTYLESGWFPGKTNKRTDTQETRDLPVGGGEGAARNAYANYGGGPTSGNKTVIEYDQELRNFISPKMQQQAISDSQKSGTWASAELAKFNDVITKSVISGEGGVYFDAAAVTKILSDPRVSEDYRTVIQPIIYAAAERQVKDNAAIWNLKQQKGYETAEQAKKSGLTVGGSKVIQVMEPNGQPLKVTVSLGKDEKGGEFYTAIRNDTGQPLDWKKAVEGTAQSAAAPGAIRAQIRTIGKSSRVNLTEAEVERIAQSGSVDDIIARNEGLENVYQDITGWVTTESDKASNRLVAIETLSGGFEQGLTEARVFVENNKALGAGFIGHMRAEEDSYYLMGRRVLKANTAELAAQIEASRTDPSAIYGLTPRILELRNPTGVYAPKYARPYEDALRAEGFHVSDNGWVCLLTAKDSAFNVSMSQMSPGALRAMFVEGPDGVQVLRPALDKSPKATK